MFPPLHGIRVLDLTQGVAGPYATKCLADYGAEVMKVEHPDRGDVSRRMGPFPGDRPHPEASGMFLQLNTNKRSITLNLKSPSGRRIFLGLAKEADIIVESFRPGTLERIGLGPDVVRSANPDAGLVRISNFGQSGPYRDFEADDMLLYAAGGVMQITGAPTPGPIRLGLYTSLFFAGSVIAAMTLGALLGSEEGLGEHVDISLHETLTASMDRGATNLVGVQYSGTLPTGRVGHVSRGALPMGVYPCADGYVQISSQVAWFGRICRTIGREDLLDDQRLMDNLTNPDLLPEVESYVYPWLLSHTKQECMESAQAQGWPVSALNTVEEAFHDPNFRARGFFQAIDHPVTGTLEYCGLALRFHGTPGELRRAPLLGEHTVEVLTERLGCSPEDVALLRQRGVV